MSSGDVLEALISEGKKLKLRAQTLSDAGHVMGQRFTELGRALTAGAGLAADFPFDDCDVAEARRILEELPDAQSQLRNVEYRIRQRTTL